MLKGMLVGLLMVLPWASVSSAGSYDAESCDAFTHNMDGAFSVPAGGQHRLTLDLSACGGMVQNYQVTLMSAKRGTPYSTLEVYDQAGNEVGVCDGGHHCVVIGDVPSTAVYTIVVSSGSRRSESCVLNFSGAY
jgi:hypothetical protein